MGCQIGGVLLGLEVLGWVGGCPVRVWDAGLRESQKSLEFWVWEVLASFGVSWMERSWQPGDARLGVPGRARGAREVPVVFELPGLRKP